jgi:NAD(P)-dependent dehydrogenase (short-subunit alcohol dehydrogenase family)
MTSLTAGNSQPTTTQTKEHNMSTVSNKVVLVTGANRGLGRALVDEALSRGSKRVYAAMRQPLTHADRRVVPLILDVTEAAQIQAAVERVESLDVLVNNAGLSLPDDLGDRAAFDRHLAVNLFGTWEVTQAFLPALTRSRGAVVNVVSLAALAAVPVLPAYSASKAAAFALTQAQRALLAGAGVDVHAVLPGPIDTDMVKDLPVPKTPPEAVAKAIFDGIDNGEEDIFPDPFAETMAESWHTSAAKELERQNAMLVQAEPVAA